MRNDYHHLRPGLVEKIDYSIDLMRKGEQLAMKYDPTDGYYLAFSGGKDSQCLYHVAQLAGVKFKAHFSPTSVDPPEVIRFIRRNYPAVKFGRLKESIYTAAERQGILSTRLARWCCQEFKEIGGAGCVVMVGVRHAESVKRSKRNEVEVSSRKFSGNLDTFREWQREQLLKKYKDLNHDQFSIETETDFKCVGGNDKIIISPIIHWTERDVWDFLNGMQIGHCELYDRGRKRIGCILCPFESRTEKIKDIKDYPHVKCKWLNTIKTIVAPHSEYGAIIAKQINRESTSDEVAELIFDWWISGDGFEKWFAYTFKELKINFNQ